MKTVLSIAGSDSIGGAGIQADLKTMADHGVYGMSAVTAVTAQNTCGVNRIQEMPPSMVAEQIRAVFSDIRPDAVKIGMLFSASIVECVADQLESWGRVPIVIDPVMVASSGAGLLRPEAVRILEKRLMPMADLITPNLQEAAALWGQRIETYRDMEAAAGALGERYGCAVLVKGGHLRGDSNDVLYHGGKFSWFSSPRIISTGRGGEEGHAPGVHGTGCTLSSAVACRLAEGLELETSIQLAKDYVTRALRSAAALGKGSDSLGFGLID